MNSSIASNPLPNLDAKWDSVPKGWISHSSVALNQVVEVAQNALTNTKKTGVFMFNQLQDKIRSTPLFPIIKKILRREAH